MSVPQGWLQSGGIDVCFNATFNDDVPGHADVANAAVFAASDWAATLSATEINLTGALSSTGPPPREGTTPTGEGWLG